MNRPIAASIVTAALALGFAVPNAHAEGKPGDVVDPTLGQVAPADAAERLLRISHVQPKRARSARRVTKVPRLREGVWPRP